MRKLTLAIAIFFAAGSTAGMGLCQESKSARSNRESQAAQPAEKKMEGKPATRIEIKEVPKVSEARPMNFWMAHKLEFSKSMLEALTMGDFERLASDAKQLRMLGKIEGFVRRKNPDYRTQLALFDLAAQELVRNAEQENSDGAALAFNQMTTSCVACHALLRKGID